MQPVKLELSSIRIDGSTQSRVELNQDAVKEYAQKLEDFQEFPPVTVFFDGLSNWLADGFHRFHAHQKVGEFDISAHVRTGTQRDAYLYSLTEANLNHGLRLSNEDKRKRVISILKDDEWQKWSNREIARRTGVDEGTVRKYRESICGNSADTKRTVERNGISYVQETAKIGKADQLAGDYSHHDDVLTDDIMDSPEEMLEDAYVELEKKNEQLKALQSDDLSVALSKAVEQRQQIEGRLSHEMEVAKKRESSLQGYGRLFAEIRKELGVEEHSQIIPAIRRLKEANNG